MNNPKVHSKPFLLLLVLTLLYAQAPAEDSPQALLDRGLRLLNEYQGSRQTRLEGWVMMEKAASAGHLGAKIAVAEYDAGFMAVNQPQEEIEFAEKYHLPKPPGVFKPNLQRALEYFRDAARSGHAESMVHLALLYSSGIGEPRDESETPHRLLLTAAGKGDGEAMLHLSNRYLYGHGEKADLLEAARWRYLAWLQNPRDRFASDRFELLDGQGNPKVEENVPMTEMAEVLSLIVKTVELHDAKS
jgi:TPR repeat protein